jgi:hypothetical protein
LVTVAAVEIVIDEVEAIVATVAPAGMVRFPPLRMSLPDVQVMPAGKVLSPARVTSNPLLLMVTKAGACASSLLRLRVRTLLLVPDPMVTGTALAILGVPSKSPRPRSNEPPGGIVRLELPSSTPFNKRRFNKEIGAVRRAPVALLIESMPA